MSQNIYDGATIRNIHLGSTSKGRGHIIYAELVSADGMPLISATLDYILDALKTRLPPRP